MKCRILIGAGAFLLLSAGSPVATSSAALITGWGADTGGTNGTVTDDTIALGAGDFHTSTPTGNLAPRANLPGPVMLTNVGDEIILTGQVAMAAAINGNQSLRFGLFNTNGANSGGLSGGVWSGSTDTGWLGDIIEIANLNSGNGATVIDRHNSPNTSAWFSTSANTTILGSTNNSTKLTAAATYNFSLTLTLASATSVNVAYSFADTGGLVNLSGSAIDSAPTNLSFDTVGFLENATSGGAATFSNVSVIQTVPEPASLGLLASGAVGLLVRRRRGSN